MAQKKSTKRKNTRKTKKPKVYIPAYKIIILCAMIITVCMALLLVTTIQSSDKPQMTERFEENTEKPKTEAVAKTEEKQKTKQQEDKKAPIEKKQESKPQEKTQPKTAPSEQKTVVKEEKKQTEKTVEVKPSPEKETVPAVKEEKTKPAKNNNYNFPEAKNNAQLVFLFDDGGQNLGQLKPFLALPFPVTIAVLPRLSHSVETARQIRASGKHELILHQPMQPLNSSVNPGPGAITINMSEEEIRSTLFFNINEIGPIAGFNNHEGSAITADAEKVAVIMTVANDNGVFFLDSRTNKDTQVPYVATEMGYSYYERNGLFLDNEKTKENALKELRRNLDIANKNGSVIMIGHIWSSDFLPEFLMDIYPELKAKGYTFTTVSKCKGIKNSR